MSYRRPNTGDPAEDQRLIRQDFEMLSPKLLSAQTEHSFDIWLDKLILIDRLATVRYINEHKDEIPPEHMRCARFRLGGLIIGS